MAIIAIPIHAERLEEEVRFLKFVVSNIKAENVDLTKFTELLFSDDPYERQLAVRALELLGVIKDNVGH